MDLLSVLPDVPLELVFARLSPDDLMRLRVNRALREAVEGARVWTHHARVLYDCGDKDDGSDAWQQWCAAAREFGRYGALYGRLRRAWRTIYAAHNEVVVPGASEAQIAALEAETGFSLPLELRCQLRITQGESHNRCLLGSFEVYQVLQRRFLLPLDAVRLVLRRGVLAVAAENGSAGSALLGLDDNGALAMCGHVLAPSWTQYVEDMAAQLQSGRLVYAGAGMGVSLFPVTGIARAVTRGILVEASPLFLALPSFSQDQYMFAYQIRIRALADDAPRCRLESRRWVICSSADSALEVVQGPGVIGLYPDVYPGMEVFAYQSICHQRGPGGWMEGQFTMRTPNGQVFSIDVPRFHFEIPPPSKHSE